MVYEFVSEGIRGKLNKLIIYTQTEEPGIYNLAFGDKDELTGEIDDKIVSNNGDSTKVLFTVASTIYTFTQKFPDAIVLIRGSTEARTRLYKIGISNNLSIISKDFDVFGLSNYRWLKFESHVKFDAFLIRKK